MPILVDYACNGRMNHSRSHDSQHSLTGCQGLMFSDNFPELPLRMITQDRIPNFSFPPPDHIGLLYFTCWTHHVELLPDKVWDNLAPLNRLVTRHHLILTPEANDRGKCWFSRILVGNGKTSLNCSSRSFLYWLSTILRRIKLSDVVLIVDVFCRRLFKIKTHFGFGLILFSIPPNLLVLEFSFQWFWRKSYLSLFISNLTPCLLWSDRQSIFFWHI